jgi:hypothetical protein
MQGLELSEKYFTASGLPMIRERFPAFVDRIAAGLVGDGSECFGFDDVISRDHDWGPSFCLWLAQDDYAAIGKDLQQSYLALPGGFMGYPARDTSQWGSGRVGVFETGDFYSRFIGMREPPRSIQQWRMIPEVNLAAATNGKVFMDPLGEFTAFRAELLSYYPEDIRLKKMAARCVAAGQAGQYNYPRCLQRKAYPAALMALARFMEASVSLAFLLNRRYMPFYKWMHRVLRELPALGQALHTLLSELAVLDMFNQSGFIIERIEKACSLLIKELQDQQLSDGQSDFILDHAAGIQSRVADEAVRSLPLMSE